jgi:hypothetical protein
VLIEMDLQRLPAGINVPSRAEPAEVSFALRDRGWTPYRIWFDASERAWIAAVIYRPDAAWRCLRLLAEEYRGCQSNPDDERKEPDANPGAEKCGAKHEHHASVANLPLILESVAFNKQKNESRGP